MNTELNGQLNFLGKICIVDMRIRKLLIKLWLFLIIACFSYGIPETANSASEQQLEKVTLQLRWTHQFQFAGYYTAIAKGFYSDVGLEVSLREGRPNLPLSKLVTTQEVQYAVGDPAILIERSNGIPVVALAAIFQRSPSILITLKSSITTPQDLIDKRIMMSSGAKAAPLIAMLRSEGLIPGQWQLLKPTWKLADLINGKTDAMSAYITDTPYLLEQQRIDTAVIDPHDYGIDFYDDILFTSQHEVDEHSQRVARFLSASLKGWEYALAHQEEIVNIILSHYIISGKKLGRDNLLYEAKATEKLMLSGLVEIGHMNPGRWRKIAETYAELGMMAPDFSLEGFLYTPPLPVNFHWQSPQAKVGLVIILVCLLITTLLLIFNRALKKVNQALKDSENRFRSLSDAAFEGIIVADKGRILDFNKIVTTLFGYTADTFLNMHVTDLVVPDDRQEVQDKILGAYEEPYEIRGLKSDGSEFPLQVHGKMFTYQGRQVRVTAIRDLTQQKEAENERKELIEQLNRAQQLAKLGHWELNLESNSLYWSDEVYRIFGLAPQESKITYRKFMDYVYPEDRSLVNKAFNESVKNKLPYNIEHRILLCDGTEKWVREICTTEYDKDHNPLRSIGTVLDITDKKTSENKLREYAEKQGILLREVNHRVKNNLIAIIGMLHQESDRARAEEGKQELSKRLDEIVGRVSGLLTVHSLLSNSRWEPLPLYQLCQTIIKDSLQGAPPEKSTQVNISPSDIMINSDQAHYLAIVLNELATNTVKYALQDKDSMNINVTFEDRNGSVLLMYYDDGAGYPEPIINGVIPNTSIGIKLVTGIIEKSMQGGIEFKNDNGAMTQISFPKT